MFFKPIIARWGLVRVAEALHLPVKNVRRWDDMDSIPAGWFSRIAATGLATVDELLTVAEAKEREAAAGREIKREAERRAAAA